MSDVYEKIEKEAPPGTRGLTYADMGRLRVDEQNRLMWMGNLVQVQRKLTLSVWQTVATIIIVLGTAAQGALAVYDLGNRIGWWALFRR